MPLRPELPSLPPRMQDLPLDDRGYPVPAFVCYIDGKPDFRVADADWKELAYKEELCYVCAKPFTTRHRSYVLGPMCVINRTIGEPAVHRECAVFSVQGCPFLMRSHMVRRENDLPENIVVDEAGLKRNPGVTAIYQTRKARMYRRTPYAGGYLLFLDEPEQVEWYKAGRPATHAEVMEAMASGYSALVDAASRDGMAALQELRRFTHRALPTLPPNRSDSDMEAQKYVLAMVTMLGEAVKRVTA